uniref:Small ribosomal subunit protein uS15 n=1 Tax=Scleropages formosus TaxID=113540 RepID=A0A8C9WKM7_SCLFO
MGRMHAPGKGLSQSALPYRRSVPTWLKLTSDDVKEQIFKLAKKGLTPSQIGVILRDSHGVAQVRFVTGNKILRILKSKGLAPDLPEDLYHLIKKAVAVRKHLERNRKVRNSVFQDGCNVPFLPVPFAHSVLSLNNAVHCWQRQTVLIVLMPTHQFV